MPGRILSAHTLNNYCTVTTTSFVIVAPDSAVQCNASDMVPAIDVMGTVSILLPSLPVAKGWPFCVTEHDPARMPTEDHATSVLFAREITVS